jgi:hypothetical protein
VPTPCLGELDDHVPIVPDSAAVRRLLSAYQGLLGEVVQARRNRPFYRRLLSWGAERFAVEHLRESLAILERRYSAHAALADRRDPDTDASRERLAQLAGSLPPRPSRLRALWLGAAVLIVARILLSVFEVLPYVGTDAGTKLANAAGRAGDLSFGNVSQLTDLLLDTSLVVTSFVVATFGIATYLVLRPLGNGARGFRTARRRIASRESEVFGAVGLEPASDPQVDFIAKACLAAPFLLFAALEWHIYRSAEPPLVTNYLGEDGSSFTFTYTTAVPNRTDALIAVVLGSAVVLRLTWLWLAARRTGTSPVRRAVALLTALLVLAIGFGIYALPDRRRPSLWLGDTYVNPEGPRLGPVKFLYACDEPCDADFRFRGTTDEDFEVRPLPDPDLSNGGVVGEGPRIPAVKGIGTAREEGGPFPSPMPPGDTQSIILEPSPDQRRWMRHELRQPGVRIDVAVNAWDDAYNTTRGWTEISARRPRRAPTVRAPKPDQP